MIAFIAAQRIGSGAAAGQARRLRHYHTILASRSVPSAAEPLSPGAGVGPFSGFNGIDIVQFGVLSPGNSRGSFYLQAH